jgi:hypothetical protein
MNKGMKKALKLTCFKAFGGEGGIRTHVGFYPQLDFELLPQVSGRVSGRNLKSSENTLKAAPQLDFCHVKVRKSHHCADARNSPVFASF